MPANTTKNVSLVKLDTHPTSSILCITSLSCSFQLLLLPLDMVIGDYWVLEPPPKTPQTPRPRFEAEGECIHFY